jgi:hypothetical protein
MEVARLVEELFALVQGHQGYFHISDGETFASKAKFFERIRGRLHHGKQAVRLMEGFLKKHGQSH